MYIQAKKKKQEVDISIHVRTLPLFSEGKTKTWENKDSNSIKIIQYQLNPPRLKRDNIAVHYALLNK